VAAAKASTPAKASVSPAPKAAAPTETAHRSALEPEAAHAGGEDDATSESALRKGRRAAVWQDPRVLVAEAIWGYALMLPGGTETPLAWIKPLGLNSKMTLLHLGAGLGGVTRAITKELGVWVTGADDRPDLVEGAMELSTMAGLGKKAPVKRVDPSHPDLASLGHFNAVFCQEWLWRMSQRRPLMSEIHDVVRKHGRLLLVDYVAGPNEAVYGEWQATERVVEALWPGARMAELLRSIGFDVRVAENVSDSYRAQVEAALAAYCRRLRPNSMDKAVAKAVLGEIETWKRRVGALAAGGIEVYRFDATRTN
jgi:cyclopropane fatty-acyl-phospholipid synthase-like methyltransferase